MEQLYLLETIAQLNIHCVKSVPIQSFSGPYFPAFGLNTEIYEYNVGKYGPETRKTQNTDTFHTARKTPIINHLFIVVSRLLMTSYITWDMVIINY